MPLLARYLSVDARIVRYLLDSDVIDERIRPYVNLLEPGEDARGGPVDDGTRSQIVRFAQEGGQAGHAIIHLRGPYGAGKQGSRRRSAGT